MARVASSAQMRHDCTRQENTKDQPVHIEAATVTTTTIAAAAAAAAAKPITRAIIIERTQEHWSVNSANFAHTLGLVEGINIPCHQVNDESVL